MPTTRSTTAAPQTPPDPPTSGKRKARRTLLLLLPVLLLAVAGWYLLLGPGGGSDAEAHLPPEPGAVVPLEPITMNLADGRLLKVGLALQLPASGGHDAEMNGSVALDEAIAFLGEHTYEQLAAPGARSLAKQELSRRVAARYSDEVMEVYFTEFVMQ